MNKPVAPRMAIGIEEGPDKCIAVSVGKRIRFQTVRVLGASKDNIIAWVRKSKRLVRVRTRWQTISKRHDSPSIINHVLNMRNKQ